MSRIIVRSETFQTTLVLYLRQRAIGLDGLNKAILTLKTKNVQNG